MTDAARPIGARVAALLDVVGEPADRSPAQEKLVAVFAVAAALLVEDMLERGEGVDAIDPVAWLWGFRLGGMMTEVMAHARACRREREETA